MIVVCHGRHGGTQGKSTPLATMVRNFKKGYTGDYEVTMSPGKLETLCELEWPTFGVGWPAEGSLDRSLVQKIWQIVTRDPGHPNQFPYIDT